MECIIKIKGLNYNYRKIDDTSIEVLKNINLEIKKGEFLAILGKNGSGKSTLAKLINGIIPPDSGSITVNQLDVSNDDDIWKIRQTVGLVFQNPDNQIVATTVEEDVAFGPENLGLESKYIREKVDRSLELVGMSEYKKQPPHMLSGGQKQRVTIAGILAIDPEIMILDEPTAMLDPIGKKEVINTIVNLNKNEKKTIIHITHDMEEVLRADRVVIIDDGEIVMDGNPEFIFSDFEKIKKLGLDAPIVTKLANKLKQSGLKIDSGITDIEILVNSL